MSTCWSRDNVVTTPARGGIPKASAGSLPTAIAMFS